MIWDRWDDAMDDVLDETHTLQRENVKLVKALRARDIPVPPREKFEEPKARDHNDMYNNRRDEADHERRRKRERETALRQATPGRPAGPDDVTGSVRETVFGTAVWDAATGRELVSYPRLMRADGRQPAEREGDPVTAVGLVGEAGNERVIFYEDGDAEYLPVRGVGRYVVEQYWLAVERRDGAGR